MSASTEKQRENLAHALAQLKQRWDRGEHSDAARSALYLCGRFGVPMPDWLAKAVTHAIASSERGKSDDVLGIGNANLLSKWRRRRQEIRDSQMVESFIPSKKRSGRKTGFEKVAKKLGFSLLYVEPAKLKAKDQIAALADMNAISVKRVEKTVYQKQPTSRKRSR